MGCPNRVFCLSVSVCQSGYRIPARNSFINILTLINYEIGCNHDSNDMTPNHLTCPSLVYFCGLMSLVSCIPRPRPRRDIEQ